MPITTGDLLELAAETVRDPASAGRRILGLGLSRDVGWMGLVLAGVVSALLTGLSDLILPAEPVTLQSGEVVEPIRLPPVIWGMVSVGGTAVLTLVLYHVGRMQGGRGDFTRMLVLMAWLQAFAVGLLAIQILCLLFAPVLAFLAVLAGLVISFRALAHFVTIAHGFDTVGRAAGVVALSFLIVTVAGVVLLSATGMFPEPVRP